MRTDVLDDIFALFTAVNKRFSNWQIYTVLIKLVYFIFYFFNNYRYTNGRTSTGNALERVRTQLIFNTNSGARENTNKIIFVITDGKSNLGIDPIIPAAKLKESDNVTIVALGVTNKINQTELQAIASSPAHVFHLKNFAALKNLTQSLQKGKEIICREYVQNRKTKCYSCSSIMRT